MFQTEDHSLVNSLVKLGKITHEEVAHHPQRNVIIRAIQGTDRPTEADVVLLDDIKAGVVFCSCVRMVYSNVLTMMSFRIYSSI